MGLRRFFPHSLRLVFKRRIKIRDVSLDFLRGIAVFFMLLAHSVFFLYAGENSLLHLLKLVGDTFCFTVFLFVSGTVTYLAYLEKKGQWENSKGRLLRRSLVILAGYYLVAIVAVVKDFHFPFSFRWLKILWPILSFQRIPGFTEFLIPLVFFRLLIFPLRKFYLFILRSPYRVILFSLLIYLAGALVFPLQVVSPLLSWKALLVGQVGWYTFPLLQYFPVFTLGLVWGRWISRKQDLEDKEKRAFQIGLVLSLVVTFTLVGCTTMEATIPALFSRWPPSPLFLILGLAVTFLLLALSFLLQDLKITSSLVRGVLFLGKQAFPVFIAHSLLLQLFKVLELPKLYNPPLVFLGFLVLLIISSLFAQFQFVIYSNLSKAFWSVWQKFLPRREISTWTRFKVRYLEKRKRKRLAKKRYLILVLVLLFVLLGLASFGVKLMEQAERIPPWWNDEYSFYKNINVSNIDLINALPKDSTILLEFNHALLVEEKKSLINGDDARIVYWDGQNFKEVDYVSVEAWNTKKTFIAFKSCADIWPKSSDSNYYLYYGNVLAESPRQETVAVSPGSSPKNFKIDLGSEVPSRVQGIIDQHWLLKGDGFSLPDESLRYQVLLTEDLNLDKNVVVSYEILGLGQKGYLTSVGERKWEILIDLERVPPGVYQIQSIVEDAQEKFLSQKSAFFISYPLYVVWSIDWEGYDVTNSTLEALVNISQKHLLPITHMFNPRIYTNPDLSPARRQFLTQWIKKRKDVFGDEIGLHLHMFPDFVQDAGVEARFEPKWGNWQDGYDILTTSYDYEETVKLLERGKWWFLENGLGSPISFRAGGWFADAETLKAVETSGFYLDASGRDRYIWGPNRIPGFWNLDVTSQPYKPSLSNQNKAGFPSLDIWEFPNNGGSSYDLILKEMMTRFDENFPQKQPLINKRIVTYLSHAQWFSLAEQERVDNLFSYIDEFSHDQDWGPVKYVTLEQAYQAWAGE